MSNNGKWLAQKARLANQGLVHAVFTQLADRTFHSTSAIDLEPALIGRHSQRLGEILDRCLTIRKDIRELEVLEVKAATDYDLFINTSKIDEQMDILRLQQTSKLKQQTGFHNAAGVFSNTATLEKGLSEIAQGLDGALQEDLTSTAQLQDLIKNRWQTLRDYQDAYHARHNETGNAHNYGERATLLLEVLSALLDEALARATAVATGVERIYGVKIGDVPTSVTLQTLDQFAVWALNTIRSLSRAAEQETTSEIIIPLVQPWLLTGGPLIKEETFNQAVLSAGRGNPVSLSFDLPTNTLLDSRARLKGIGVSFGNTFELLEGGIDRAQTADVFTRLTVKITTPQQGRKDGSTYRRPDLLIGNVGLHSATMMSWVEGNAIENLSPFGTWSIVIHPFFVWKDGKQGNISQPTYSSAVQDLKLALRLYVPGAYT